MFNIFKSKKKVQETIQAIHNEFDAAGERLLIEAKNILSVEKPDEKGERLKNLGFIQSKAAEKNAELRRRNEEVEKNNIKRKEAAKWVEYYNQWYPHHKFITQEIVKEICDKYNLYCGDVAYYKADVPLKNVTEMEQFKLRQEDMDCYTNLDLWARGYAYESMINSSYGFIPNRRPMVINEMQYDEMRRMEHIKHHFKPDFKICASEKDFDMRGMVKKGRFLVPDPIVLQPVKGGYLIVTKWGLEASDDLVINEVHN